MEYTEIIKKIIGNVRPVGETNTDNERFENLKSMCVVAENLLDEIQKVADEKSSCLKSAKKAGEFANDFLKGVSENYPQIF